MNLTQIQRLGPRLVDAHPNLIWKKARAERRFKKRHTFMLEADQRYVADLCVTHTCIEMEVSSTVIYGERRLRKVADARHVAMTVAYELSGLSSIVLGVKFNRGHDMILWAQQRVNETPFLRAQADKVVRAVKKELRRQ